MARPTGFIFKKAAGKKYESLKGKRAWEKKNELEQPGVEKAC